MRVSRRAFLAAAGATAAALSVCAPGAEDEGEGESTLLHVACSGSENGGESAAVWSFAVGPRGARLAGRQQVEALAALAAHPRLPVVYALRNCSPWRGLPRAAVACYAVGDGATLTLAGEAGLSLSATGARSIAASAFGRALVVAAEGGQAWNSFALDEHGLPSGPAVARKEARGVPVADGSWAHPRPAAAAFAPGGSRLRVAACDAGTGRLALLDAGEDALALHCAVHVPEGLARIAPVWTTGSGSRVVAVHGHRRAATVFALENDATDVALRAVATLRSAGEILALHGGEQHVWLLQAEARGARVIRWRVDQAPHEEAVSAWLPGRATALAGGGDTLWLAGPDGVFGMGAADLQPRARAHAEGMGEVLGAALGPSSRC